MAAITTIMDRADAAARSTAGAALLTTEIVDDAQGMTITTVITLGTEIEIVVTTATVADRAATVGIGTGGTGDGTGSPAIGPERGREIVLGSETGLESDRVIGPERGPGIDRGKGPGIDPETGREIGPPVTVLEIAGIVIPAEGAGSTDLVDLDQVAVAVQAMAERNGAALPTVKWQSRGNQPTNVPRTQAQMLENLVPLWKIEHLKAESGVVEAAAGVKAARVAKRRGTLEAAHDRQALAAQSNASMVVLDIVFSEWSNYCLRCV